MRKINTILVPIDFTESSRKAMEYAFSLAECFGATLVLLHVVDRLYVEGFLDSSMRRSVRAEAHCLARKKLDDFVVPAIKPGVTIKRIVRDGTPEYEILRAADRMKVGLIVLGRRRRSAFSRLLFGSIAHDVIDTARCPVLVMDSNG